MSSREHLTAYHVITLLIGLVLGGLILPESAEGCSCAAPRGSWEARAEADAVFAGTAVEVTQADDVLPLKRITFRVDNSWKGDFGNYVVVTTASSSAACGIHFEQDQNYLVYADRYRSRLSTNMCMRTAPLERAREDIQAFEKTVFLGSNYPDPFNPVTTIVFGLPAPADVSLKVYDRSGQLIETLVNKSLSAGDHRTTFDGSNLPSGIYFYRMRTGNHVQTRSMVLLR